MKKYIYRSCLIFLFLAGFIYIYYTLDYFLSDDTSSQTRVTFHDYYEDGDPDILFLGTSHTVHNINAVKISEDTGKSVYNLSTSAQDFILGYYVIKEALQKYDVEQIFCEVSISRFNAGADKTVRTYIISDYMKSQLIRAQLLCHSFDSDGYISAFSRLRRNVDPMNLPSVSDIKKLYWAKSKKSYKNYTNKKNYLGRGQFKSSSKVFSEKMAVNLESSYIDDFDIEDIQEEEWDYFVKIMELCQRKGVKLTLLISPYSEYYLMSFDNYEKITQLVYDEADKHGVKIADLTLVKKEFCDIQSTDFYSLDHVTDATSVKIADFLDLYIASPQEDYFCKSVEERFPPHDGVTAVGYRIYYQTENGEYKSTDKAQGTIDNIRLEISALAYNDTPAAARLWVVSEDKASGEWVLEEEVSFKRVDDYTTEFITPYNKLKTNYKVELLDPDTGELLFETITRFNME